MREQLRLSDFENYFPNMPYSDITLLHNGHEQCAPGKTNGPFICDHYLFHLVVAGKGRLTLNKCSYSLEPSMGFLICPGQLYQYVADEQDPWEYLWMGFRGERVGVLLSNSRLIHTSPVYVSQEWKKIEGYMSESVAVARQGGSGSTVRCYGLLFLLLAQILEETSIFDEPLDITRLSNTQMQYVYEAIEYIRTHLSTNFTTRDVASALGLNRSYFSRLFTQLCGVTPSRFIMNYRLDIAWSMLRHSNTPIALIAQNVGFQDAAYLTYCFHERYGRSPSQVRAEGNSTQDKAPSPRPERSSKSD